MTYRPETEHDEAPPALHTCAPPPRFEIPSFTVLDLEAVVRAGVERAEGDFPRPVEWQIVTSAVGVYRRGRFTLAARWGASEALVQRTVRAVETSERLVTFGGKRFDVPVLVAEAMRYRHRFPWAFSSVAQKRYTTERHIDVCDYLASFGAAPHTSLGTWLMGLGFPTKTAHGSVVDAWFRSGRLREIAEYNAEDVRGTARLFLRAEMVAGRITAEVEAVMQGLVEGAVAEIKEVTT